MKFRRLSKLQMPPERSTAEASTRHMRSVRSSDSAARFAAMILVAVIAAGVAPTMARAAAPVEVPLLTPRYSVTNDDLAFDVGADGAELFNDAGEQLFLRAGGLGVTLTLSPQSVNRLG